MEKVGTFGVIELQGTRDRVEHRGGYAGQRAAFELAVVLDADPGECGDLAAPKSRHPARADDRQPRLLRGDLGTPRDQELADLGAIVHVNHGTARPPRVGCLLSTPFVRHSYIGWEPGSLVVCNPGKLFDLELPIDKAADGNRAMDQRRAIKVLLRP
jgi:hypothetical protein